MSDDALLRIFSAPEGREFTTICVLPDRDDFAVGQNDGTVLVARMPNLPPGDFDDDGDVDLTDLSRLLARFGLCTIDPGFEVGLDLDFDGCIGLQDLAILLGNFGI